MDFSSFINGIAPERLWQEEEEESDETGAQKNRNMAKAIFQPQQQEEIALSQRSLTDIFPNEVTRMFLEHMSSAQRAGVARVCKMGCFLNRTFLRLPEDALGKEALEKILGVDVGKEPPLPGSLPVILDSEDPHEPGKMIGETYQLMLVPEKIGDKPLTHNNLRELLRKKWPSTGGYRFENVLDQLGDILSGPSHWVLVRRDVIPGSRNMPYATQKALVEQPGSEYKVPHALTMVLYILANAEKSLYSKERDLWTYTRCQEQYEVFKEKYQVAVGDLERASGLYIRFSNAGSDYVGVGAVWKF